MTRLTDNDRHFGPVTYARCSDSWRPLRLVYSSGGDDDIDRPVANTLTAYACGWVARLRLPRLLDDFEALAHSLGMSSSDLVRRIVMVRLYGIEGTQRMLLHQLHAAAGIGPESAANETEGA